MHHPPSSHHLEGYLNPPNKKRGKAALALWFSHVPSITHAPLSHNYNMLFCFGSSAALYLLPQAIKLPDCHFCNILCITSLRQTNPKLTLIILLKQSELLQKPFALFPPHIGWLRYMPQVLYGRIGIIFPPMCIPHLLFDYTLHFQSHFCWLA